MKTELAETILRSAMSHWTLNEQMAEIRDIQVISEIKYDDFQNYTHGTRYVENLALWLRQFKNKEDRQLAYDFIKNELIYISEEEMKQLVSYSYPIIMMPYILHNMRNFCDSHPSLNLDVQQRRDIFSYFRRRSLFLGLSDGSHMDFFRRQNRELSNEQVFLHYDLSQEKADDMLAELKKDNDVCRIRSQFNIHDKDGFESYFLIDDFSGSGTSYLRKDESGWHGKIKKFFDSLKKAGYDLDHADIHLVLYLATKQSIEYLNKVSKEFCSDSGYKDITIDRVQDIIPINWDKHTVLLDLLKRNFEENQKEYQESYVDRHFNVGKGKCPYKGYADCSLPLVLYHNTPNNSLPVLWYSWGEEVNALFLRITRHKE